MKRIKKSLAVWVAAASIAAVSFTGCEEGSLDGLMSLIPSEWQDMVQASLATQEKYGVSLGYFGTTENLDEIPNDISLGSTNIAASLPSSVDLRSQLPPIGNQGQYGTCVSWSVGYNLKTFLHAVDNKLTSSELAQKSNQFSPKDLFWSIPNNQKGAECNGTGFEPALDIMQTRGLAKMSTIPYENLQKCNYATTGGESEAANFKIDSYREIATDKATLKEYLAQGRVIAFGAKLGDEFMDYTSGILDYQTYGYTGQHAYHAMALAGYDDSKGSNGAFLVVNSWGTGWGDKGYIWVDQNFFSSQDFCFCAFVATNVKSNPDNDNDGTVDDNVINEGNDITAWHLEDYKNTNSNDPWKRTIKYNVYNSGKNTLNASSDWSVIYMYYNAFNADDYGILLFDYYSDDYGSANTDGPITDAAMKYGSYDNYYTHYNIPSGQSASKIVYGSNNYLWGYDMPTNVSGEYYLVLWVDPFEVIGEYDESNNYLFFTTPSGDPLTITNGNITDELTSKKSGSRDGAIASSTSPDTYKGKANAYSPQEIMQFLENQRNSGALAKKASQFKSANTGKRSGGE